MARRLFCFILLIPYLNILTLIPGIRTAQLHNAHALVVEDCIGENYYEEYESLCEILLNDLFEQKDTDYQSDDYPVSCHCVASSESVSFAVVTLFKPYLFGSNSNPPAEDIAATHHISLNNSDIHAQYNNYLFRLTPF